MDYFHTKKRLGSLFVEDPSKWNYIPRKAPPNCDSPPYIDVTKYGS